MKKYLLILLSTLLIALAWSCKKNLELIDPVSSTAGLAFIKIVHASPNFRQVFKGSDSFNVFVNDAKLNGAFLTYNSIFPTSTNLYAGVTPGSKAIRISINGKLTSDSLTLATFNKTLLAGTYYSFIVTDEALNTNEARQMWLTDQVALTDTIHFTLRFVDAVLNDPGAVDVYSFRKASNIFSNVSPATATAFSLLNYTLQSDTLSIRTTGTQTEITRINGAVLNRTRAYTLLYKGQLGGTGTKARLATLYAND